MDVDEDMKTTKAFQNTMKKFSKAGYRNLKEGLLALFKSMEPYVINDYGLTAHIYALICVCFIFHNS